jgi:protein phosphatase
LPLIARAAARTDIGRVRRRNEDAVRVEVALGLVVVADGMGGHPAGDLASTVAIEALLEPLRRSLEPSMPTISGPALGAAMAEAVRSADRAVRRAAWEDAARAEMGTTLTALLLPPGAERAVIGHVGDSRAYRFRSGALELLTRDHSWVWDQVVEGRLTPEQAWAHPRRNLLTQALGVDAPVEPDALEVEAHPGDVFLLCSDGLSGMLRDSDIEALLVERLRDGLDAAAAALVEEANRLGGKDNVTVALVEVGGSAP